MTRSSSLMAAEHRVLGVAFLALHIDLQDCNDAMNGRNDQDALPPYRLVPALDTGVDYPVGKHIAPWGEVSAR